MPSQDSDKLYLIIIVAMVGVFLYLYQLKVTPPILSDIANCEMCKAYHSAHLKKSKREKKHKKVKKEHNKKKKVSFKNVEPIKSNPVNITPVVDTNDESEISLNTIDNETQKTNTKNKTDNDSDISLDM